MTKNLQGTVYLVPLPIGPDSAMHYHTPYLLELLPTIQVWIAENARTLRRYLSSLKLGIAIDNLNIFESNQHTPAKEPMNSFPKLRAAPPWVWLQKPEYPVLPIPVIEWLTGPIEKHPRYSPNRTQFY